MNHRAARFYPMASMLAAADGADLVVASEFDSLLQAQTGYLPVQRLF